MISPALFLSLLFIASFLYSYTLMRLGLRPWERVQDQHWTERARWLWLARKSRKAVGFGVIALSAILWHELAGERPVLSMVMCCGLGGCFTAQYFIDRRIWPGLTLRLWLGHTSMLLGITLAIIGIVAWVAVCTSENLVPMDWLRIGMAALLIVLLYSGVWLFMLPGLGKNSHTPRLRQIVAEVVAKAGIQPVRAWVMGGISANAFALMHIRSIMVTAPAMKALSDDELQTLVQHEVAHLCESLSVRCMRLMGGLSWLGFAFTRPVVHRLGIGGMFWILLGVILVKRLTMKTAMRMENRADSMSVTAEDEGPVYARALEKLYQANQIPAVMTKRLLHPDLYDRMMAAGLTPDYPCPSPPPKRHWTFFVAVVPVAVWLGWKLTTKG